MRACVSMRLFTFFVLTQWCVYVLRNSCSDYTTDGHAFRFVSTPLKARVNMMLSPHQGPISGGTLVQLGGYHIGQVGAPRTAQLANELVYASALASGALLCYAPKQAPAGANTIRVHAHSARSAIVHFNFFKAAKVFRILPAVGPIAGGTRVLVEGTGFLKPRVDWYCSFGSALTQAAAHPHRLECDSPAAKLESSLQGPLLVAFGVASSVNWSASATGLIFAYVPASVIRKVQTIVRCSSL